MKLTTYTTKDMERVIAIKHEDMGIERLERIMSAPLDQELVQHAPTIVRMVESFNVCDGLSDVSLRQLATGTASAGSLAQRVVAISLLYAHNQRLATAFLTKAEEYITKNGGKV